MLQKFLCWLFGHKTLYKVATGEVLVADGVFDRDVKYPLMKWEVSKFCLRCGVTVYEDKRRD